MARIADPLEGDRFRGREHGPRLLQPTEGRRVIEIAAAGKSVHGQEDVQTRVKKIERGLQSVISPITVR